MATLCHVCGKSKNLLGLKVVENYLILRVASERPFDVTLISVCVCVNSGYRPPSPLSAMSAVTSQPSSTGDNPQVYHFNNCKKIFVQRDYSEGTGVRFQVGRIEF